MPPVRLERLAKLAFDQIRQASPTTPAVLIHQLEAIRRLAPRLPDACRQELSDQADAILENRELAGRTRSSRPRCGMAPGTHRSRSAARPSSYEQEHVRIAPLSDDLGLVS